MSQKSWPERLIYPVIVNVTTAIFLFLLATAFRTEVQELFDVIFDRAKAQVSEYPLICIAEPYRVDSSDTEMNIDFFVINNSGNTYDRDQLSAVLSTFNKEPSRSLSPDIVLKVDQPGLFKVQRDIDFNAGKGVLVITENPQDREIKVVVKKVEAHAILKFTIIMTRMNFVSSMINRSTKVGVPIDDSYLEGCYQG